MSAKSPSGGSVNRGKRASSKRKPARKPAQPKGKRKAAKPAAATKKVAPSKTTRKAAPKKVIPRKVAKRTVPRRRNTAIQKAVNGLPEGVRPLWGPLPELKQERFCHNILRCVNATQAAIRAGYSPKTSKQQASRLLTHVDVLRRIAGLLSRSQARLIRRKRETLAALSRRADAASFSNFVELQDVRWETFREFLRDNPVLGDAIKKVKIESIVIKDRDGQEMILSVVKELVLLDAVVMERELAKMLGWYKPEQHEIGNGLGGTLGVFPAVPETVKDWEQMMAAYANTQAAGRKKKAGKV